MLRLLSCYWCFMLFLAVIGSGRGHRHEHHDDRDHRNVTYEGRSLIINGHRKILFSGSIHYPRSTPQVLMLLLHMPFRYECKISFDTWKWEWWSSKLKKAENEHNTSQMIHNHPNQLFWVGGISYCCCWENDDFDAVQISHFWYMNLFLYNLQQPNSF